MTKRTCRKFWLIRSSSSAILEISSNSSSLVSLILTAQPHESIYFVQSPSMESLPSTVRSGEWLGISIESICSHSFHFKSRQLWSILSSLPAPDSSGGNNLRPSVLVFKPAFRPDYPICIWRIQWLAKSHPVEREEVFWKCVDVHSEIIARDGFLGPVHHLLSKKDSYEGCNLVHQNVEQLIDRKLKKTQQHGQINDKEQNPGDYCMLRGLTENTKDRLDLRDSVITILIAGTDCHQSTLADFLVFGTKWGGLRKTSIECNWQHTTSDVTNPLTTNSKI